MSSNPSLSFDTGFGATSGALSDPFPSDPFAETSNTGDVFQEVSFSNMEANSPFPEDPFNATSPFPEDPFKGSEGSNLDGFTEDPFNGSSEVTQPADMAKSVGFIDQSNTSNEDPFASFGQPSAVETGNTSGTKVDDTFDAFGQIETPKSTDNMTKPDNKFAAFGQMDSFKTPNSEVKSEDPFAAFGEMSTANATETPKPDTSSNDPFAAFDEVSPSKSTELAQNTGSSSMDAFAAFGEMSLSKSNEPAENTGSSSMDAFAAFGQMDFNKPIEDLNPKDIADTSTDDPFANLTSSDTSKSITGFDSDPFASFGDTPPSTTVNDPPKDTLHFDAFGDSSSISNTFPDQSDWFKSVEQDANTSLPQGLDGVGVTSGTSSPSNANLDFSSQTSASVSDLTEFGNALGLVPSTSSIGNTKETKSDKPSKPKPSRPPLPSKVTMGIPLSKPGLDSKGLNEDSDVRLTFS